MSETMDFSLIERLLEKILTSPAFDRSPRQQDLLRFLVRENLAGNGARLKGYAVGVGVFDRGVDFNPLTDSIVRVEMVRLRAKLADYYSHDGQFDAVRLNLAKGGFVIDFSLSDTPTSQADISDNIAALIVQHADRIKPIVAVLPIDCPNMHFDAAPALMAENLTGLLVSKLFRLSGLTVVVPHSPDETLKTKPCREIGDELGAHYLLTGSMRHSPQQTNVTLSLMGVCSNRLAWSDHFAIPLQASADTVEKLAQNTSNAVQSVLTQGNVHLFGNQDTTNNLAFDALLCGIECHRKYSQLEVAKALAHFIRAIEMDSMFSAAHAWAARTLLFQWSMRWDNSADLLSRARSLARKAVMLDKSSAFAYSILSWACLWFKQRETALSTSRKAAWLAPSNPEALLFLSMSLSATGAGNEALQYIQRAKELSPEPSPFYEFALGQAYMVSDIYDCAIAAFKRGFGLNKAFLPNLAHLCVTYGMAGMEPAMKETSRELLMLLGGDRTRMALPPWLDVKLESSYNHYLQQAGLL